MHWFDRMNRVLEYVDDHICDFDSNVISRIMVCPYSVFLRTFAPITGISFSEYVRRRRLSRAAYELCNSSSRIIDIALKYGYTSADAFSSAFKKQHGVSPSKARKGNVELSFYPKIVLSLNISGTAELKYTIEKHPAFSALGLKMKIKRNEDAWTVLDNHPIEPLLTKKLGCKCNLGICFGYDSEGNNDYMCASEFTGSIYDEFNVYHFPELTWLVFTAEGSISNDTFHKTEDFIYGEFIPQCVYNLIDLPVVQRFIDWNITKDYCHVEFMIPIQSDLPKEKERKI